MQQLQAFCARVAAKDDGYLRTHVHFPLARWHNVVGDRCSSGMVPCKYRQISIADPQALVRERPCGALDFSDPSRIEIVEVDTDWMVDAGWGQLSDWLRFTSLPDSTARLVQWGTETGQRP